MLEENSEKLTINISVVDLGKIDYLVEQGLSLIHICTPTGPVPATRGPGAGQPS